MPAARLLLCLAAARAAFWHTKKKDTRVLPHVINGLYDTSWHARNVSSWHDIRKLAPRDGWTAALVVAADDVETPCDDQHDQCASWAEGGECDANPGYMLRSCRSSCKSCAPCGSVDAQSLLVSLRHAQRNRPARFLATGVARRSQWRGAWPFPGDDACGAFLVEPRDDIEEEAPSLQNAVSIPLSDARGLRYALAERVRHSMAVKKFAVTNELDVNITLHWFDLEQEEGLRDHSPYKQVSFLEPGASTSLGTFVGHVFAVGDEEGRFLGQVTVRGVGDAAVINEALIAEAETCQEGSIPHDPHAAQGQRKEMARLASLEGPEGRDARVRFAVGEKVRDLAFEKRKALSDVQIALTPNVTEDGFRLIRTPSEVFEAIERFYNASHATHRREEDDGGPLYNQHQITTWHTPLPPDVKRFVFDELQKTMEAWAPSVGPLKGTSAYGVRTYETGSYLHLHVDTAQTHVVSGIMNVAQDLEGGDDWPVEILDHGGKLHAVNMKPGDLLLYESARLLHGRPSPFKGRSYANVFVHYQPQDGWEVDF
jgi:hypothetical protein